MLSRALLWLSLIAFSFASTANTKTSFCILFIGNSYTFYPAKSDTSDPREEDPYLPVIFKQIAESKRPNLRVLYHTQVQGGAALESHAKNRKTARFLSRKYDAMILQGYSIESLDLPRWFKVRDFSHQEQFHFFGEDLVRRAGTPRNQIFLFANWAYHANHDFFQPGFPGLKFRGGKKAGKKWFGENWSDATRLIENSYADLAKKTGAQLSPVGRAWLMIQADQKAKVSHDSLYYELESDFSHPSYRGSYLTACVLYATIFQESPKGAAFEVRRISAAEAEYLQAVALRAVEASRLEGKRAPEKLAESMAETP